MRLTRRDLGVLRLLSLFDGVLLVVLLVAAVRGRDRKDRTAYAL